MASSRQRKNGTWEFTVKCKAVQEKPFYFTFDTKEEGLTYIGRLEALIRQGIIPTELTDSDFKFDLIGEVIRAYMVKAHPSAIDIDILSVIFARIGKVRLSYVNYAWVETWIAGMKHERNLAPSTIRHHVGALARCFDWASKVKTPELVINPLRLLAKGYAMYNERDRKMVKSVGLEAKHDESRVRRLENGEEDKIRALLTAEEPYMLCIFELALESAMRMREIYTLTVEQVDFEKRTIFLDKTKNGDPRQVPMTSVSYKLLKNYIDKEAKLTDNLFQFWNGILNSRALNKTTSGLSQKFSRVFKAADCVDLHFHDLRHEATSRLFEKSKLSDAKIMKITGHKGIRMLLRYANLRGSDLSAELW